jgi:hypothetical protein
MPTGKPMILEQGEECIQTRIAQQNEGKAETTKDTKVHEGTHDNKKAAQIRGGLWRRG